MDGLDTQYTSMSWMKHFSLLGLNKMMFLSFQVSYIFFIFRICLRYSLLKFMSLWCVYHACSFDFLKEGNLVHFQVSCFYYYYYFIYILRGSFCYSWSCFIFMHFPIYDHELYLCFSCFTYVLMSCVGCFRKHDTFHQFVKKIGSKNWVMMDDSSNWFCHRIAKGGSL